MFAWALSGCSGQPADSTKPAAQGSITQAQIDALAAKATAACECSSVKGEDYDSPCWTDYKAATEPFRTKDGGELGGAATACAPISTTVDCLGEGDDRFCIALEYSVTRFRLPEKTLCKAEEAKALEDAYNAEMAKADGDPDKAMSSARDALAAVRAGKVSKASSTSHGCV